MRRLVFLPTIVLALVAMAGPSFAQAQPGSKPEATKSEATSTIKPAAMRRLTGSIVSVDAQAKTLVVKRMAKGKSREYTLTAEKDAASMLSQLKPGERVTVSYVEANGQMTAEKIAQAGNAAKK